MATKRVEAFQIAARIEVDNRRAQAALRETEAQAKKTTGVLGRLKGAFTGGGDGGGFLEDVRETLKILPGLGMVASGIDKVVGSASALVSRGFEYSKVLEETNLSFSTILKSAEKAEKLIGRLEGSAASSSYEFTELLGSAKALLAGGFTDTEIPAALRAIRDGARGTGAEIDSVIRGINQLRIKGVASLEEISGQLGEQNIPGLKYISNALAKQDKNFAKLGDEERVTRVRKLVEQGKISGKAAAQAILVGMQEEFDGLDEAYAKKTLRGIESNVADPLNKLLGRAFKPAMEEYKGVLVNVQKLLGSDLAAGLADSVAGAQTSVFSLIKEAIPGVGADIADGLRLPIGQGALLAASDYIKQFKVGIGAHSPATEFIPIGAMAAQGFKIGFMGEMGAGGGIMGMLANGGKGRLSQQQDNRRRLDRVIAEEPEFLEALKRESAKRQINPDDFLNLMAVESSFRKSVINKWGYLGLGQVGRDERAMLGLPRGDAAAQKLFASKSYTWQLENVLFPFYDIKNRASRRMGHGNLSDLSEMYAAWGSGHSKGDPNAVHAARRGLRAGMYANNPVWDTNKDGRIQEWEFGVSARKALGAGVNFTVNDPGYVAVVNPVGAGVEPRGDLQSSLGVWVDRPAVDGAAGMSESAEDVAAINAGLRQMSDGITIFDGKAKDAGLHVEGIGDIGQTKVVPFLVAAGMFSGELADNAKEARDALAEVGRLQAKPRRRIAGHDVVFRGKDGKETEDPTKAQAAVAGMTAAWQGVKDLGKEALAEFGQGMGSMVESWVLLGDESDVSMQRMTASVLAGLAAQATVLSAKHFAMGLVALTPWGAAEYGPAPMQFAAAAIFAGIAGGSALAGRAVAGDSFKDKNQQTQEQQNQLYADASNPANNFTRRATGGPAYRGRAYIVGDGGRPEVFEPSEDGYVHRSVGAYADSLAAVRRRKAQVERGGVHGMEKMYYRVLQRVEAHLERVSSMPAGEVFVQGARQRPKAAAEAALRGMDSNHEFLNRMRRRMA